MGNPVVHFEIGCEDRARAETFYGLLFGWTSRPHGSAAVRMSTGAGRGIDGDITIPPGAPRPYVMLYVEVEDLEAACERAEALGGQIVAPPADLSDPVGGRSARLADPEGNLLGLIEKPGDVPA